MSAELVINAAQAAILAQQSAWLASVLSMVMIIINATTLLLFIWMARKILFIEHNTNSMHDKLMVFSREAGVAEGRKEHDEERERG